VVDPHHHGQVLTTQPNAAQPEKRATHPVAEPSDHPRTTASPASVADHKAQASSMDDGSRVGGHPAGERLDDAVWSVAGCVICASFQPVSEVGLR